MADDKLPPIEGELTDEDLKQVCGGDPPTPLNGGGYINQGGQVYNPPGFRHDQHQG